MGGREETSKYTRSGFRGPGSSNKLNDLYCLGKPLGLRLLTAKTGGQKDMATMPLLSRIQHRLEADRLVILILSSAHGNHRLDHLFKHLISKTRELL